MSKDTLAIKVARGPGRPRRFYDAPPLSVRLNQSQYDELCQTALRRHVDVAVIIRERLVVKK
jgi:hypothetical protein